MIANSDIVVPAASRGPEHPEDFTEFIPSQAWLSEHNWPRAMGLIDPPVGTQPRQRQHFPVLQDDFGNIIMGPNKRPLRNLGPEFPRFRISTEIEEFRIHYWQLVVPDLQWRDIVDRFAYPCGSPDTPVSVAPSDRDPAIIIAGRYNMRQQRFRKHHAIFQLELGKFGDLSEESCNNWCNRLTEIQKRHNCLWNVHWGRGVMSQPVVLASPRRNVGWAFQAVVDTDNGGDIDDDNEVQVPLDFLDWPHPLPHPVSSQTSDRHRALAIFTKWLKLEAKRISDDYERKCLEAERYGEPKPALPDVMRKVRKSAPNFNERARTKRYGNESWKLAAWEKIGPMEVWTKVKAREFKDAFTVGRTAPASLTYEDKRDFDRQMTDYDLLVKNKLAVPGLVGRSLGPGNAGAEWEYGGAEAAVEKSWKVASGGKIAREPQRRH
jgi:hypothetical protein